MNSVYIKLNTLQKIIFSIYLRRDYFNQHYAYEKEIHLIRLQCFALLAPPQDVLFELITALGNLRYRMLDHTTFEICERELANVSMALEKVLLAFDSKKDARDELEELLARIKELEIIFEKVVRVAIKEPMLFLIFIQQLYALHQHLSEHKI